MHQSENLLAQYGADSYLRVKRAIDDLRAGRGVMVVDDENRENEGDLILSTDFLTVEQMALMIRACSGIVCVCLRDEDCKRLVPGFEAPVKLAYSSRNRSASIRIPYTTSAKARRIEVRFPDPMCNPYLGFSALLLAGLDGIQNKIHPGEAMDKNLYDLPKEEQKNVPTVAASLDEALNALDSDRQFLVTTGVFSNDFIDSYIELKMKEVDRGSQAVSPLDFELYYAL